MRILVAAMLLSALLAACLNGGPRRLPAVGTCVLEGERAGQQVPCDQPHTHRVIAIAPNPDACPPQTVMWSTPADLDDGRVTVCYAEDR